MKDLIDERNKREKMQNSIIKWWNVNMVPVEEKKDAFAGLSSFPRIDPFLYHMPEPKNRNRKRGSCHLLYRAQPISDWVISMLLCSASSFSFKIFSICSFAASSSTGFVPYSPE